MEDVCGDEVRYVVSVSVREDYPMESLERCAKREQHRDWPRRIPMTENE